MVIYIYTCRHGSFLSCVCVLTLLKQQQSQHCVGTFSKCCCGRGLPSQLWCSCDKGGENTEVAWFMLSHPCKKRYRKRISHSRERCPQSKYRKVVARCIQRSAKDLLYHMEDMDLLDPENNCLLFCLYYIFIPQIDTFTNGSRHGYR